MKEIVVISGKGGTGKTGIVEYSNSNLKEQIVSLWEAVSDILKIR